MSKLKVSDFYYGAVLSLLFNNHINPAMVESGQSRQVYDLTTNAGDCRIFIKYRGQRMDSKKQDYYSWTFTFTSNEILEIINFIQDRYNLYMVLVCGMEEMTDSEIVVLDTVQLKELFINLKKESLTVSRKKREKNFRVSIGGGRDNSMQVKGNRFDDIFK